MVPFPMIYSAIIILSVGGAVLAAHADLPPLPTITVDRDNVEIRESCIIEIGKKLIADTDGNGVIHIKAHGITVEFSDTSPHHDLLGAPKGTPWDELTGIGVRIDGYQNVTLMNVHAHRYKIGIYASNADGLVLDGCDVAGGFRQHLKSTPQGEVGSDWLFPHNNDANEWMNNFGAGIVVEDSNSVTIRNCYARQRQNGIILDAVNDSKVYDNDFSFLSGWGLAMWRSSRNVISRNAFDFCVRGYSHGVYNRGQDSAGILFFEQNNENIIAENSATHGGDGFFGFAGKEALGEAGAPIEGKDYKRSGNNDNLLINNDFSYAPAHGIEMTFSFGNRYIGNRLVGNAICGIWGGYSQESIIAGNIIENNGEGAYGLERGGINIEHSVSNRIEWNRFKNNKCGIHLWWDPDEGMTKVPWGQANDLRCIDNSITHNSFEGDDLVLHLREAEPTVFAANRMRNVTAEFELKDSELLTNVELPMMMFSTPEYEVYGEKNPVGARKHLRGRDKIIMHEWGPWDHETPTMRTWSKNGEAHTYELLGMDSVGSLPDFGRGVTAELITDDAGRHLLTIAAQGSGVYPYRGTVRSGDFEKELSGTIIGVKWKITVFPWTQDVDPRENIEAWRALAQGETAITSETDSLNLPYGGGGPSQMKISPEITAAMLPGNHFGTIASTRIPLTKGSWRIKTVSDDGIRVFVDGEPVIENWTWHAPTPNEGIFDLKADATVEIVVEHFEIDGYAWLELTLEPAGQP